LALKQSTGGAGAILDLTVHDAEHMGFVLQDEPERVGSATGIDSMDPIARPRANHTN
jgi:hypothetical protein